jgi:hypothetical protein
MISATSGSFTGMLMAATGNENSRGTGQMINPGVAYIDGPLKLRASYARYRQNVESITPTATPEWLSAYNAGVTYAFPAATLFTGVYGFTGPRNAANLSSAATNSIFAYTWRKSRSIWAGARIPLLTGTFIASAMRTKYDYATGTDAPQRHWRWPTNIRFRSARWSTVR